MNLSSYAKEWLLYLLSILIPVVISFLGFTIFLGVSVSQALSIIGMSLVVLSGVLFYHRPRRSE